jgi:hypothetical protein
MSKAAHAVAAVVLIAASAINPLFAPLAIAATSSAVAAYATPKLPRTSSGSETTWSADPNAGIPYGAGRCAIAGDIRFERSAGTSNKFKNVVSVYSVGPCDGFEGFYANGELVPFTADGGEGASGYYLNRMWQKRQLGVAHETYLHWTATGSKDTPADHGGMPSDWTAAHRLSGYAASLWGMEWDTAKYAGGVPPPLMVGRWAKVYDPRLDDTYPGGEGPHRYADPSNKTAYLAAKATWTWSANPYLHGLAIGLGVYTGDPDYPDMPLVQTHGLGLAIDDVDVASFVDGANVADANSWTLHTRIYSTDDQWEVLKGFLQAGAGEPISLGDKLACLVNTPKISMATLTGADAVAEVSLDGTAAFNERINTVWPSWMIEELGWEVTPAAAPVQVAAYLAPDKGVRSAELKLPQVQAAAQVGALARYLIEDSRELPNIVIAVGPPLMWLEPGMCITANEPEWCLNGQKLLIQRVERDPETMISVLVCRTETDAKHGYALGQTATPADPPRLTGVDPNIVPLPAGDAWAVVGGVIAGESGSLPGIVIAGEADLYDAVSIAVDYRLILPVTSPNYGIWRTKSFPASSRTLTVDGVEAGATYQVRVRYITAAGVENPGNNVDLGTVTVGVVDAHTVKGLDVGAEVAAALEAATAAHDEAVAATAALADEVDRALAAEDTLHASIVALTSTTAGNTAAISAEAIARTSDVSALTASISSLTSTVGSNTAAISSLAATSASADAALAGRTSTIEAAIKVNPNLLRDPTFKLGLGATLSDQWTSSGGWYRQDIYGLGSFAQTVTGGTQVLESVAYETVVAGQAFSLQAEFRVPGLTAGAAAVDVHWTTAAGAHLGYSAQVLMTPAAYAAATKLPGGWVRLTSTAAAGLVAPATAGRAYVRAYIAGPATNTDSGIRKIKLEGADTASLYSDDASVQSVTARISNEEITRATETSALASSITSLTSSVGANSAAISAESTTRASETSALTSSVTSLTATVGGNSASISSQATVLADHTGKLTAYAKYTAAAGGDEAYIEMVAAVDLSLLSLRAKTIQLGGVSGPVITVESGVARISNAIIGGAQIEDLTVGGVKLSPGGVSTSRHFGGYAPGGSDTTITYSLHNVGGSETELVKIVQNFSGKPMIVLPQVSFCVHNGDSLVYFGLYEDGVLIKRWEVTGSYAGTGLITWWTPRWRRTPTAGTHTYRLCILNRGTTQSVNVSDRDLDFDERNGGFAVDTSGGSI